MKKIVTCIFLVLVVVLFMAGCADGADTSADDVTPSPAATETLPANPLTETLASTCVDTEGLYLALAEGTDPRLMEHDTAYGGIEEAINAEHYFEYDLKRMEWELVEREFSAYEHPRRGMLLIGTDWYLSACEGDELVWFSKEVEGRWYRAIADGQVQDVYRILRLWYDELEYNSLEQTLFISDTGQDYLAAAAKYIECADALHLQVSGGSKYCYTYIKSEVTADEVAQQETERLREQGRIEETEYCFAVETVFVPENDTALMWGMAGNTTAYDGDDPKVPQDALQYWRCGIIAREETGWVVTHIGTAW